MKNIHLIPTDKPSRLRCSFDKLILNSRLLSPILYTTQHIYITSNEESKEGDWVIYNNELQKSDGISFKSVDKKIILTTDGDLIKDGIQAIDDEFLEWFVKNPSCEEVIIEWFGTYTSGIVGYKIIIPKEELKTSEDWQKQFPRPWVLDADGWDRQNFEYSWFEELITYKEYLIRLSMSTCKGIISQEEHDFSNSLDKTITTINIANSMFGSKEEPKQETLEETALKEYPIWIIEDHNVPNQMNDLNGEERNAFIKGAKWQAERMISKEAYENSLSMQKTFNTGYESKISELEKQIESMYTYDELRSIAYNSYCRGQLEAPTEGGYNLWIQQFKKQ